MGNSSEQSQSCYAHATDARLSCNGRLIVFQFTPHNPTRAYIEWFGSWHLIYRTASEFEHLAKSASLPSAQIEFGAEPLGIDLFASIRRAPT